MSPFKDPWLWELYYVPSDVSECGKEKGSLFSIWDAQDWIMCSVFDYRRRDARMLREKQHNGKQGNPFHCPIGGSLNSSPPPTFSVLAGGYTHMRKASALVSGQVPQFVSLMGRDRFTKQKKVRFFASQSNMEASLEMVGIFQGVNTCPVLIISSYHFLIS